MPEFKTTRRSFMAGTTAVAGATLLAGAFSRPAWAAYPERTLEIVIPTAEGGGADRDVRVFASVWQKHINTNFEYSFFPGAAGQVGYEVYGGKREPDCYSLLFANMGPEVIMQALQKPSVKLGQDFVYFMQRTVVGAPGMSKEAAAYYQDLFKKVFNSDEWQKYMKDKALQGDALSGDALMTYWKKERDVHKKMLIQMGAIKG